MSNFNKNRLREIAKPTNWLENARWERDNEKWLSRSRDIAIKIAIKLNDDKISQKQFAEDLGVSPQQVSKLLKGKENLTLETISKIESVLNFKLIEIPDSNITFNYHLLESQKRNIDYTNSSVNYSSQKSYRDLSRYRKEDELEYAEVG